MAKYSQIILPFWPLFCRWFGHYFALVGKIDITSLTYECSCKLCPNIGQFFSVGDAVMGMRSHPHAVRLCVTLALSQGCGAGTQISGSGSRSGHLNFLAPALGRLKTKKHIICTTRLPNKLCLFNGSPNFRLRLHHLKFLGSGSSHPKLPGFRLHSTSLSYYKNAVASELQQCSRFVSVSIKVIQKSDCYWVLAQVFTAPKLSKSEKILMSLNNKQKSLYQMATPEFYPKETKSKQTVRKRHNSVWVWCLRLVVLGLSNYVEPYFLAWCSLTVQAKSLFQLSKELKRHNVPG